MSEAESKTAAPAEEATAEELKAAKRPAEVRKRRRCFSFEPIYIYIYDIKAGIDLLVSYV